MPWVRRLPRTAPATIGRGDLRARPETIAWIPRTLVTLRPCELGWVATTGPRGIVHLEGRSVAGQARFKPGADVLLGRGWWTLSWPGLDDACRLNVDVRPADHFRPDAPFIVDIGLPLSPPVGTAMVVQRSDLSTRDRYWLATAFRHLLEEENPPTNIARSAALALGIGEKERTVHNFLHRTRARINDHRAAGVPLRTIDELGEYLVGAAQAICPDDLDP